MAEPGFSNSEQAQITGCDAAAATAANAHAKLSGESEEKLATPPEKKEATSLPKVEVTEGADEPAKPDSETMRKLSTSVGQLYELHKIDPMHFPMRPPRGVIMVFRDADNRKMELNKDDFIDSAKGSRLTKDCQFKGIELVAPNARNAADQLKELPQNLEIWNEKRKPRIEQAMKELGVAQANPEYPLSVRTTCPFHTSAVVDNGKVIELVRADHYQAKAGEQVVEVSKIVRDFIVEPIAQGPDAGRIKLTQKITAYTPWSGATGAYLNQKIGTMSLSRTVGPNDLVLVTDGQLKFLEVKDLTSFHTWQKAYSITKPVADGAKRVYPIVAPAPYFYGEAHKRFTK